ncbi:MAG: hydrogenase expression/formation protein HypE [Syntrophaceae bacterium]|jgi:hydrogenase expression/formation protein HypE|nr:hydrogenase expression/formation protein HypE [Syntrophaceae bacterium]
MTHYDKILLDHGGGGLLMNELITRTFLPKLKNAYLERLEDGAVFDVGGVKLCFSTDSYVVSPIFFPGGDIGSLSVHGTVNDISMCGGIPLFLSAGFILEEGFHMKDLERIIESMAKAATKAGTQIVTGDTKVVAKGAADGIFINVSGIGVIKYKGIISPKSVMPGDKVIINGTIGDHSAAILSKRQDLGFKTEVVSDSAPLNSLVESILKVSRNIHCMRDVTRGGLGAILCEIAAQSECRITIEEKDIPVKDEVRGICEILGLDPLFLANEGKMVVFCSPEDTEVVLETMKRHEYGKNAAAIGEVEKQGRGRLLLRTVIGGAREIDLPTGELVPRIC